MKGIFKCEDFDSENCVDEVDKKLLIGLVRNTKIWGRE